MAFQQRPGSFTLFKNDRKEKDNHPDYKGDGMLPDGTSVYVSAWIKEGKNGKFMSCSIQEKKSEPRTGNVAPANQGQRANVPVDFPDDELPPF